MTTTTIQVIDQTPTLVVQTSGIQGPPGVAGEAGPAGPAGERGEPGPATIAIGTVTTGDAGTDAEVSNSGTTEDVVLDFVIPRGDVGATGSAGPAGADGSDGADGREVELQKSATHVQWRYAGDVSWTDLVALADLKGDQGDTGPAGPTGSTGATGAQGVAGDDGREVELQKTSTHIQWRYVGDVSWTNLVALTDITGPTGATGAAGATGATGAAGPGVASGGTSGQILSKASSTDYDTAWSSLKTINSNSLLGAGDLVLTTSPAGSTGQLQFNSSGSFAGASGLSTSGTELTITSGTKTTSAPVIDATQTWNASGTTFTGLRLNVTDTASAAASNIFEFGTGGGAFTSRLRLRKDGVLAGTTSLTVVGDYTANASLTLADRVGGANEIALSTNAADIRIKAANVLTARISNETLALSGVGVISWASNAARPDEAQTLIITRDASDTLAQRRGTNAQTFNLYNTYTSSTSYERGFLKWSSNVFAIGTEKGSGGGTARDLVLQTDGVTRVTVGSSGITTFSLGIVIGTTWTYSFAGRAHISSPASDVLTLYSNSLNDFNRLQFGGTTSSFPAIKRNAAALNVRLADDSADANLTAAALTLSGNLTISTKDIVTDTTTGTKLGTSASQKLGFWNATPIVQPTTAVAAATVVANSGTAVNDATTFDGYTIAQVVKALRNAGLLA